MIRTENTVATKVVDVICNNCGRSCKDSLSGNIIAARAEAFGGYGSHRLTDMHRYRFDLCEDCTIKIARGFKHPPEVRFVGLTGHSDADPEVPWEATVKAWETKK
jgi:hypothetical protein